MDNVGCKTAARIEVFYLVLVPLTVDTEMTATALKVKVSTNGEDWYRQPYVKFENDNTTFNSINNLFYIIKRGLNMRNL